MRGIPRRPRRDYSLSFDKRDEKMQTRTMEEGEPSPCVSLCFAARSQLRRDPRHLISLLPATNHYSMPIVTLANLEKTFGPRIIFQDLNFSIDRGERVGLIGANGSGKTTLFKVITGQMALDNGIVAVAKSVKLGMLPQDPVFEPANTVMDEAELAFADLHRLSHELRQIEHEMGGHSGAELQKILRQYQEIQHEFELAGGYAFRHRLEATLQGVGLPPETWDQNVQTLSGGQASRLALAGLLMADCDVLLLDEPTNHLDLAAIEWLENYLLDFKGAVLIISHDRYLLDRLATRIVFLARARLSTYRGNYSAFMAQRQTEELSQQRQFQEQQADIDKQKEFIRRFGAGQRSKEAKGRDKRLQRLLKSDAMIDAVESRKTISLSMNTSQRAGDQVLGVNDLCKAYGDRLLWKEVSLRVTRGERIGIIGPNGSGKTTLLEILLGRRQADSGHVRWGANLAIGYYDQKLDDFDPQNSVMEEVRGDRQVKDQELRNLLAALLFRGDDVHKPMALLSGGERARVALAQLLIDKPNVLLLDEPTNHLDIDSRTALEGALGLFPGTIICVSHDRYFLDRTVRRLLVLQPPAVLDFEGTYSAFLAKTRVEQAEEVQRKLTVKRERAAVPPPRAAARADNPYLRPFGRLSTEELEQTITKTEITLAECQDQFADAGSVRNPSHIQRLQDEYAALAEKLQQLEAEYFNREQ